ncbi:MAG TPA: TIGR02996 domain-containing protein, partial [Enhygromyxa sp.]|nr:TIGR02996 domain-containing protein [Enhygromyxa sp.]
SDSDIERSLVEAIVAAWDDDGPRLVYSDWLQSRKDARGEFIALDIALRQGKKVKGAREKYFKANKDALLGPLAGLLNYGEKFERGFLDFARISTRSGGLDIGEDQRRALLGDLRWALIRGLDVSRDDDGVAQVFEHAPLLALERLSGVGVASLRSFARRQDSLPLRTLEISGRQDDTPEDWQQLGALVRVLPKVESIEIMIWAREGGRMTPPIACFRSELVRRARELVCGDDRTGGVSRVDEWLERVVATECPVKTLRLIGSELTAEVQQTAPGRFEVALTLDGMRWPDRDEVEEVLAVLRGLPRDNIVSLKLQLGAVNDEIRPDIDAALAGVAMRE